LVRIKSGNRCDAHNKAEGGAEGSKHKLGIAADIVVTNVHADEVADYLEDKYPHCFGIGRYKGRTHIDVRVKPARWDNR
jgi:uncharacterized protein YcbK (DUF882 family)